MRGRSMFCFFSFLLRTLPVELYQTEVFQSDRLAQYRNLCCEGVVSSFLLAVMDALVSYQSQDAASTIQR